MNPVDHTIVIGRQYGAGGRQLGHLLASRLGLPYYDKELLTQASQRLGFRSDLFQKADEKRGSGILSMLSANYGASTYFTSGAMHTQTLYQMQSDVIRALMEEGPCVIVGRTADYIGRDNPLLTSLFLHADKDVRVQRTLLRHPQMDADAARSWLDKQDSTRAEYYNYYTGRKWGSADNYHLCLDTSALTAEQTCEIVELFLRHRATV